MSQRLAARGVVLIVTGLLTVGCGPSGPPAERDEARLTVTALGTSDEVDQALKNGSATDPAAALRAKCLSKGVSKEDAAALEPNVKLRRVDMGDDRFCLVLEAACMLPVRKSGLSFTCPDQRASQLAYDACRAVLDDLFGRATKAASARPKRLFIYFEAVGTQMNVDDFFAELRPEVDAACRKAGWKSGEGDEPPVKATHIQHNEAVAIEYDEGWEDTAAEMGELVREKLRSLGWKVENP